MKLLAEVVNPHAALMSARGKIRRNIFDYALSLGFPFLIMATHIIYQPNRFGLSETIGCLATLVNTWPAYILYLIWQPLLAATGAVLAREFANPTKLVSV